jgi:hypothetical protein
MNVLVCWWLGVLASLALTFNRKRRALSLYQEIAALAPQEGGKKTVGTAGELPWRAHLRHPALVEHDDFVIPHQGLEPVGDAQDGDARERAHGRLHGFIGAPIERGRGLVE